jgi:hypothetical protein
VLGPPLPTIACYCGIRGCGVTCQQAV